MIGPRRRLHSGRGIGSVLKTLFSKIAPIAKTIFNFGKRAFNTDLGQAIAKSTQQNLAEGGIKLVDNVLKGENVKNSLKSAITETGQKTLTDSANLISETVKDKYLTDSSPKRSDRSNSKRKSSSKRKNKLKPSQTYIEKLKRRKQDFFT